ncbi:MAG: hypothetical protein A3E78_05615 [Alphaproteobacteria bacterium RIFCSPHIGHO2_12_FULL_63_12]|nr:MAG: hypothetical protein A3E78_05615 [Alphaproteobacteria bacterium RIFCSPHIGHO2_12_FULL_63_12]
MSVTIFLVLCALAVAGLLYAERADRTALKWVFKPAASLAFILAGIAAGAADTAAGAAVLAGLVFCALGDILLIPRSQAAFLAGMGAFAAGHAAYFSAFLIGGVSWSPAAVTAFALTGALSAGLLIWLRKGLGAMAVPVALYALVISVMVAGGVAHWSAARSADSAALAIAAAGFALSDVSVARDRFGGAGFINRLWGLPLYFAAQCLFAVSV